MATRLWKLRWSRRRCRTSEAKRSCGNSLNSIPKIPARRSGKRCNSMAKAKSKGAYMISSVAEQYQIHPQTLRLYEREGLLKPSRSEGNTRLYTDEDLELLEVVLHLSRDLGVNLAGVEIILNMRAKMGEMNRQMQSFVEYVRTEVLTRAN